MTTSATTTTAHNGVNNPRTLHAICKGCYPGRALKGMCGAELVETTEYLKPPSHRPLCVICVEFYPNPCQHCGTP